MQASFVFTLVNTSKENKNFDVLAGLGYPQRFGFPVLVILDQEGNRIHTQNSAFLEKEKSYNEKTVFNFLKHWTPDAINPANYK